MKIKFKKITKWISITVGLLLVLVLIFYVAKYNAKPEVITLKRTDRTEIEIDELASELIRSMSIEEKVQLMSPVLSSNLKLGLEIVGDRMRYNQQPYEAGGNSRLRIPTIRFFDGPRGLVSGEATCFPAAIARGASFDRGLETEIGKAIGEEIRARGGNYFGGVCINLLRHPAGGRAQEGYGEDSHLTGQMGVSLVHGVQSQNVMACVKHFALNNQENKRFEINIEADERVLREVYLPHFKVCVDGGAASLMGAYNKFRNEQACESEHLLNTILRKNWGFKGFTISDFVYGIRDTQKAVNAGLDVEMPAIEDYGLKLVEAIKDGKVSEEKINESAFRVARTILKFETRPDPRSAYPPDLIGSQEHVELALRAAEKSMVLLQNRHDVLPLDPSKTKTVLLIGRLAIEENIGDHGSSRVYPPYVVTPLNGFKKKYGETVKFLYSSGKDVEETKALAREADAVVFVVGYSHGDEGEYMDLGYKEIGGDRQNIRLAATESNLLSEIGPLNNNSIAILIGGSAIIVDEWKAKVNAIVHAFYPGMEGGTAIAKTVFGDNNPGGKLPFTIATEENHYPHFDRYSVNEMYDRYHGYIKLDHDGNRAAFPFGHGLSYSTFELDSVLVENLDDGIIASANIKNTGTRTGDQVLQLYIGMDNSAIEREHKLLKDFERITLAPGEKQRVVLRCPSAELRWYNSETDAWELEKIEYQVYVGTSSDESNLYKSVIKLR